MSIMRKKKPRRPAKPAPTESRSSEAITVAWMVTLTTLFFCNVAILGVHMLSSGNAEAQGLRLMKELLLVMGCSLGVLSLVLLAIVYRVRRVTPPTGIAVFGACLAVAPILALIVRSLR